MASRRIIIIDEEIGVGSGLKEATPIVDYVPGTMCVLAQAEVDCLVSANNVVWTPGADVEAEISEIRVRIKSASDVTRPPTISLDIGGHNFFRQNMRGFTTEGMSWKFGADGIRWIATASRPVNLFIVDPAFAESFTVTVETVGYVIP